MDFIDLEAFSAVNPTAEPEKDEVLPEPSSMLNLAAYHIGAQQDYQNFKIPDLENRNTSRDDTKDNLYDRMAQHASLFMKKINLDETDSSVVDESKRVTSQFTEPTKASLPSVELNDVVLNQKKSASKVIDQLLLQKLSRVLNEHTLTNYSARTQIRKSLQSLEENKERLMLDDEKLIESGYVGNLARKSMRSGLEGELLKDHLTILEELTPIIRRVKRLSTSVENIKSVGHAIISDSNEIHQIKEEQFLEENIRTLREEIKLLKLRKRVLSAIKDQFALSQVEDDIVANGSVNAQFFDVVAKTMNIKEKATILLALPNSNAGSSLIVKVNHILENVNRKVFNYLVDFLYNYESGFDGLSEKTSSFGNENANLNVFWNCLIYLSSDLEYFNEFLVRVTQMRAKNVLDEFLSQFEYNPKDPRPIMLSTDDPLRYIGDVLANVHASIANEADFVKSLFHFQNDFIENSSFTISEQSKEFLHGLDLKLLNDIIKSLANACRIRVEQVVKFEEDPVINLRIFRLLNLYQLMFKKQGISEENLLVVELSSLCELSRNRIESYFVSYLSKVSPTDTATQDLMPPEWIQEYISKMAELFEDYDRGSSTGMGEENAINFEEKFLKDSIEKMVDDVLPKRLQQAFPLARKNDEARSSLLTVQVNCLDLIKSRLQPFACTIFATSEKTAALWSSIESKLKDAVNRLLDLQVKILLEKTGLGLYYNLFNMIFPITSIQDELDYDMYLSLCENPLMKLETIREKVNKSLNEYAPQALTEVQANLLFRLTSPSIADHVCDSCLAKLCLFYITFRRVLMHLYPDRKDDIVEILNFTEQEFETLLGIHQ